MWGWELAGLGGSVVLLDQGTKALAVHFLAGGRTSPPLRLVTNEGMWLGRSPAVPVLLGLWALALGCAVLAVGPGAALPAPDLAVAGLVVALAGATGNLIDRLCRGAIVDFVALPWWPAFNLADVAIVGGVAVALGAVV
jgi:signal peptidase II